LFVDGFVHPVFGLFGTADIEITVLLSFTAIVQDIFPNSIDTGAFISGTSHDFGHDAGFVGREKVQGGLELRFS